MFAFEADCEVEELFEDEDKDSDGYISPSEWITHTKKTIKHLLHKENAKIL